MSKEFAANIEFSSGINDEVLLAFTDSEFSVGIIPFGRSTFLVVRLDSKFTNKLSEEHPYTFEHVSIMATSSSEEAIRLATSYIEDWIQAGSDSDETVRLEHDDFTAVSSDSDVTTDLMGNNLAQDEVKKQREKLQRIHDAGIKIPAKIFIDAYVATISDSN